MGQYSSLCVSAVVSTLGGDDIEDGVPDREQVDCEREKVEAGEKQKKKTNTKRQQTHAQTCGHVDGVKCALRHLKPRCECNHMCKVYEKNHV